MKKKSTTLTLSLNKKWFDLIKSGEKTEEYRRFGHVPFGMHLSRAENQSVFYWNTRLVKHIFPKLDDDENYSIIQKDFDKLVFTLGYPNKTDTSRRLVFKNPKIRIGTGKPEWGAEPGELYFVITWSK